MIENKRSRSGLIAKNSGFGDSEKLSGWKVHFAAKDQLNAEESSRSGEVGVILLSFWRRH